MKGINDILPPGTPAEASTLMLQLLAQLVRTGDSAYAFDVIHTLNVLPQTVRAAVAGALDVAANGQLVDCPLCAEGRGMLPEEVAPHILRVHSGWSSRPPAGPLELVAGFGIDDGKPNGGEGGN